MARQVLDNGVILPSEYSDDWYDDMTSNLTKLDEVIGSDAEKLSASDVGEAAISNDYDDLDDKPAYNILRRASVTLTAGGTGNYYDLDSDSKIKAGDYVLDAANKLYSITAIDTANSTYTVSSAAIINITDKSELGAAALSNDYDDLDDKPTYNILRRASVTLTAGGTGNYSDLDSDSKIKAGDYVLDAANKLYSITAIDAANSTYTVSSAAIINITDKSELGAAALSNDYDDLNDLPTYGITRLVNTAITDNSNVAFANISSVSKIAAGDFLLDTAGKMYLIASVDTANETVSVTTPLTVLALDANVVHTDEINSSGIGIIESVKEVGGVNFNTLTTQGLYGANASGSTNNPVALPCVVQVIKRQNNVIQIANVSSAAYKSRYIRYCADITAQSPVWQSWIRFATDDEVVHKSGNETISGNKTFSSINGVEPSSLGMPDLSNGIDISGYITVDTSSNSYTAIADGWISIKGVSSGTAAIYVESTNDFYASANSIADINSTTRFTNLSFPVIKNEQYTIVLKSVNTSISAKFFPCQGNV